MSKKTKLGLEIIFIPFIISASIEFLPTWLYVPVIFIGSMFWLGACILLSKESYE